MDWKAVMERPSGAELRIRRQANKTEGRSARELLRISAAPREIFLAADTAAIQLFERAFLRKRFSEASAAKRSPINYFAIFAIFAA